MYLYIKKCIFIVCSLFSFLTFEPLLAQEFYVDYSPLAKDIYNDIIDLKLEIAKGKIIDFKQQEPYNLARLHLENYLDFFTIFISEDEVEFKKRIKNKSLRISLIEDNLPDSNPYKKFIVAEINLQWSLTRSKFNQLFRAGREVYKAYNLLKDNEELFPDFIYNKKSLSILHALIETITIANVFKSILGLQGSIELAKNEINKVVEFGQHNNFIFAQEADAIKVMILFYQANEKDKAWSFIQNSSLKTDQSLLAVFLVSKLAQRIGANEKAIEILSNKPNASSYSKFYYLDYQMGLSLLRKLDPNCEKYFLNFVEEFNGKHFVKEAYQKLAWASLVFDDDVVQYNIYMEKVKTEGDDLVDDDKQAVQESKRKKIPNTVLLKSRLLFDGGYYKRAIELLNKYNKELQSDKSLIAEYNYRRGRILQKMERIDQAEKNFQFLIKNHSADKEFYACNAALQLGIIAENSDDFENAKMYFTKCLTIKPKSYKRGLHQKAKSGLKRIVK